MIRVLANFARRISTAALLSLALAGCEQAVAPPTLSFGQWCDKDSECSSGICLPSGRCTKLCASAADCPQSSRWRCAATGGQKRCECQASGPERCDGQDNDCDGQVDNGATCPGGNVCSKGVCACGIGMTTCGGKCVDIEVDVNNCGACDKRCEAKAPHTVAKCIGGDCAAPCQKGFGDCDADPKNGCDTALDSIFHCGSCDRACAGQPCVAGVCKALLLASGQYGARAIAVDETHVYYRDTARIKRVLKGGGAVEVVFKQVTVIGLALDQTSIYWSDSRAKAILSAPKGGGSIKTLASGQTFPTSIVVDGDTLFWTDSTDGMVKRTAKTGGPVTVLAKGQAKVEGIATNATHVFWLSRRDLKLRRIAKTGGAISELNRANQTLGGLAADGQNVYYTDSFRGILWRVPVAGGKNAELAAGEERPTAVALDSQYVYWTTQKKGAIRKILKTGGIPLTVATEGSPSSMVLDAKYVYYTTIGGEIYRVPK